VDELLKKGIEPYVTMFHWDLPEALPGGWQSRDTAYAFADYAGFMAKKLGDRVRHFMTTNEFDSFTDGGYQSGDSAPGLKLDAAGVNQVRHNALLAHGLGVQAIRAHAPAGTMVGLAEDPSLFCPVMETPEHIEAVRKAFRDRNAPFLVAILDGKYSDSYLAHEGANAPKIEEGDMKAIGSRLDFVGMNCYHAKYVRADGSLQGYAIEPMPASYPHMASSWIELSPECIYWGVRTICELWPEKAPMLYITENGTSSDDVLTADGRVEDVDRVMYLRAHLTQLHRAAAEGYPVNGYFLWSLLDNFEWSDGYSKRFGIHYVDFKTQKRTPKLSAEWYRATISANAVE
jgi:beta-glucosidase